MSEDFMTWAEAVESWQSLDIAWQDTLAKWENGPLSVKRGIYGSYLITWAGGVTGRGYLVRTTTYTDGRVEYQYIPGSANFDLATPDVWVDGDAPYGEGIESITFGVNATKVTVPPESRRWEILSDPFTGLAANVIGSEITDLTWESATTVAYRHVTPLGAPHVHSRPEQSPSQQLAFYTTSRGDRELVARMCANRRPLLLRSPNSGVDDMWFALDGARTEQRLHGRLAHEEWRQHTWTLRLIDRPDHRHSGRHVSDTLGGVRDAVPTTLGDVAVKWSTLGDIALAQLRTGAEVVL